VDLGVALEAHWNCVIDVIVATFVAGDHVVGLDFHAAKSMADTTAPVTSTE
jgi:hypothetical protein